MANISNSYTGGDVLILDNIQLNNFPNGKVADLTYDDTLVEQKIGKTGNSINVYKQVGNKAKFILRVMRGSVDDIRLNSRLLLMKQDLPSFVALTMSLSKRFGDGTGSFLTETHSLANGVFTKNPGVMTDVDGDTEQSITVYEMSFATVIKAIV